MDTKKYPVRFTSIKLCIFYIKLYGERIITAQACPGFETVTPNLRPSEGFDKACPVG